MELEKVNRHLYESLSFKLGLSEQNSLSPEFLSAVSRKLHMKKSNPTVEEILDKMAVFGLELDHIKPDLVKSGDQHQVYFFLDILNVLLDSIFQAKQKRNRSPNEIQLSKKENYLSNSANSSGGEEISKILDFARKTYGRVHSFKKDHDKENLCEIKPQKFIVPQPSLNFDSSSSGIDSLDNISKPLPLHQNIKTKKKSLVKKRSNIEKTALNESEQEINVKIPTSDTTDVVVRIKPLDNEDLKNKRIHVRINKLQTPERPRTKRIVYGRKSLIGHHLRKTRSPMFSSRAVTPRLDKNQLLRKVIDFTENAKRDRILEKEKLTVPRENKDDVKLKCQKLIRDKRTNTAQLRKLIKNVS